MACGTIAAAGLLAGPVRVDGFHAVSIVPRKQVFFLLDGSRGRGWYARRVPPLGLKGFFRLYVKSRAMTRA